MTEATNPAVGCPLGLQLPPKLSSITAHWLVPNYTAQWQRHVCKQLAKGCTLQRGGQDLNPRPVDRKSGSLTTRPPSHTKSSIVASIVQRNSLYDWTTEQLIIIAALCYVVCVSPTQTVVNAWWCQLWLIFLSRIVNYHSHLFSLGHIMGVRHCLNIIVYRISRWEWQFPARTLACQRHSVPVFNGMSRREVCVASVHDIQLETGHSVWQGTATPNVKSC